MRGTAKLSRLEIKLVRQCGDGLDICEEGTVEIMDMELPGRRKWGSPEVDYRLDARDSEMEANGTCLSHHVLSLLEAYILPLCAGILLRHLCTASTLGPVSYI